jgi:leucyl-tRNA synthetase
VTEDLEALQYHTAIAGMMEYVNLLRKEGQEERERQQQPQRQEGQESVAVPRELIEPLVILLAPFAPHFAEECWERLGHPSTVFAARWPAYDPALAKSAEVEVVVQVNGKVRARMVVEAGLQESDAVAHAASQEPVRKFIEGKKIRKAIYVPDRLVNLVV